MAYILKRKWKNKTTFRVQVTRKGFKSAFKSFPTRTEAKKWGAPTTQTTQRQPS